MARIVKLEKGEVVKIIDSQRGAPKGKRITIEQLSPKKREALAELRRHVLANSGDTYFPLLGADPQDEAELLGRLHQQDEIPEIKRKLKKARITKEEFKQAVVDTLTDKRIWSLDQTTREDYAASIYNLFRRVRARGRGLWK